MQLVLDFRESDIQHGSMVALASHWVILGKAACTYIGSQRIQCLTARNFTRIIRHGEAAPKSPLEQDSAAWKGVDELVATLAQIKEENYALRQRNEFGCRARRAAAKNEQSARVSKV